MIFTKTGTGGTDKVWFYDMAADGYSLDDKRNPIEANDIPDILNRWKNPEAEADRKRTDKSFYVPVKEIRKEKYDLSINRYKEIVYEEVKYDPPKQILAEIMKMEDDIQKGLKELDGMLG
jgi:type I restriction enzyme M protein